MLYIALSDACRLLSVTEQELRICRRIGKAAIPTARVPSPTGTGARAAVELDAFIEFMNRFITGGIDRPTTAALVAASSPL